MDIWTALGAIDAKSGSFAMSGASGYDISNLTSGADAHGYIAKAISRGGTYAVSYTKKPKEEQK